MTTCLIAGCAQPRGHERWPICGTHVRLIPNALVDELLRTFSPSMTRADASPGFYAALAAAEGWIATEFAGGVRDTWDPGKWERLCRYVRERDERRARLRAATDRDDPGPTSPFRHLKLVP